MKHHMKINCPTCHKPIGKFQDIFVTQILREINFGESESTETAVNCQSRLGKFQLSKSAKIH